MNKVANPRDLPAQKPTWHASAANNSQDLEETHRGIHVEIPEKRKDLGMRHLGEKSIKCWR